MQIERTIVLHVERCPDLIETVEAYSKFRQDISAIAFNGGDILSAVDLHKRVYYDVPTKLRSQMRCSAIRSVASAYVSARTNRKPADHPFSFKRKTALFLWGKDVRITRDMLLSISTINGRKKLKFDVPEYARHDFELASEYNSVTISGTGEVRLCLTLDVPDPTGVIPVGIDLGATNALVASTETDTLFISGLKTKILNKRTRKTRQCLKHKLTDNKAQHKDTHSVRKVLKRLSRKQSNRSRTFCRESAAKLCRWVPKNAVLVFEDLRIKQVRKDRLMRKGTRRKLSQWCFNMMTQACVSRAEREGVAVAYVDPAYTSQRCSKCGQLGDRRGHRFSCSCGHTAHADVNASHNIRLAFTVLRSSGRKSTRPEALVNSEGKPPASCWR